LPPLPLLPLLPLLRAGTLTLAGAGSAAWLPTDLLDLHVTDWTHRRA